MLVIALRCRSIPTRANWILLGAFTGVAALINPALMPCFVAIMGWVAFEGWRAACATTPASALTTSWKSPALGALALLLVTGVVASVLAAVGLLLTVVGDLRDSREEIALSVSGEMVDGEHGDDEVEWAARQRILEA